MLKLFLIFAVLSGDAVFAQDGVEHKYHLDYYPPGKKLSIAVTLCGDDESWPGGGGTRSINYHEVSSCVNCGWVDDPNTGGCKPSPGEALSLVSGHKSCNYNSESNSHSSKLMANQHVCGEPGKVVPEALDCQSCAFHNTSADQPKMDVDDIEKFVDAIPEKNSYGINTPKDREDAKVRFRRMAEDYKIKNVCKSGVKASVVPNGLKISSGAVPNGSLAQFKQKLNDYSAYVAQNYGLFCGNTANEPEVISGQSDPIPTAIDLPIDLTQGKAFPSCSWTLDQNDVSKVVDDAVANFQAQNANKFQCGLELTGVDVSSSGDKRSNHRCPSDDAKDAVKLAHHRSMSIIDNVLRPVLAKLGVSIGGVAVKPVLGDGGTGMTGVCPYFYNEKTRKIQFDPGYNSDPAKMKEMAAARIASAVAHFKTKPCGGVVMHDIPKHKELFSGSCQKIQFECVGGS